MRGARFVLVDASALTLVAALVLAWPLATPPIGTHGEAREGLVVRDVVERERWILPLRDGEVPSKPPLFHWIAAAASTVVAPFDVAVRLPSALGAWLVVLVVYGLGVAIGGRASGWLAAGALAGMHTFFESATEARVDMLFTACVTAALAAFLWWDRGGGAPARAACWSAATAAVLTKGPAGVVLPGLVIVAFLAAERRLGRLRALWSWRLATGALAVGLGWYLAATWRGGSAFVARQILHENVDRFVGRGVFGLHGGRSRLAMVENLATDLLPWNLVLPWAAVRRWRGEREDAAGRFLHAWWIVIVLFFTAAYGKRGVYLLPLHPAVALLAGRALATLLARLREGAAPAAAALLGRLWPGRPARALVALVVAVDLGVVGVGQLVRQHRAARASLVPFARAVAAEVPPDARLVADASLDESDRLVLAYRLDRPLPRASAADACVAGAYRLARARDGAPLAEALVRGERRGVPVVLRQDPAPCPAVLEGR